jgi:hypothetical protein
MNDISITLRPVVKKTKSGPQTTFAVSILHNIFDISTNLINLIGKKFHNFCCLSRLKLQKLGIRTSMFFSVKGISRLIWNFLLQMLADVNYA